jgi:MFS family permease
MASQIATIATTRNAEYGIWRVIVPSAAGTMIERYDFFIFGSLVAVLSLKFYPPGNDIFAYIAYLTTFAVGFVVRPFGALFFGRIGDVCSKAPRVSSSPLIVSAGWSPSPSKSPMPHHLS